MTGTLHQYNQTIALLAYSSSPKWLTENVLKITFRFRAAYRFHAGTLVLHSTNNDDDDKG